MDNDDQIRGAATHALISDDGVPLITAMARARS